VLMNPIVPGLTSQPAKLEATIKAIADHGAAFVGTNVLYLKDGTRTHFMGFLEKNFPELWKKYQRLYPGAYARGAYSSQVRGIVRLLQKKYSVSKRDEDEREKPRDDQEGQAPLTLFNVDS
jgi:DNA repair photolyase